MLNSGRNQGRRVDSLLCLSESKSFVLTITFIEALRIGYKGVLYGCKGVFMDVDWILE